MRHHMLLWGVCLLTCLARVGHSQTDGQELAERIDPLFAQWDRSDSPGCAIGVFRDGEVLLQKGYGMADLEHGVPIGPETVFYIGSTSKQFVTACIVLLAQNDDLSLDDDIRDWLPEFPDYGNEIIIRDLIHHTSGIRDYLTLWQLSGRSYLDAMDEDEVLQLICRQKELNFEPGSQHLYSNSCYFLLSVLVERVTGKSLREYAEQEIFQPLGMNNSHFHDDHRHIIRNRADGYEPNPDGGFHSMIMRFDLVGSGGLYTTVADLFHWDRNFADNQLGLGGPEFVETMLTRGELIDGNSIDYAFALMHGTYRGVTTVSHGGALGGYRAELLRFPEQQFSVAVISNLASFVPTRKAQQIADVVLEDELEGRPTPIESASTSRLPSPGGPAVTIPPGNLPADQLAQLMGDYTSSEVGATYRIDERNGHPELRIGAQKILLSPRGNDVFSGEGITFRFESGTQGITGFRVDAGRVRNLLFVRQ